MKKLGKMPKSTRSHALTFAVVVVAYFIMLMLKTSGNLSSSMSGMLVPICAYIVMSISLNLTVGIMGDLSLGHAGFMAVGAFSGTAVAMMMQTSVESGFVRLLVGIIVGAIFAGFIGFLIGIPVLKLNGDYLAIVTLAFGEIIKSIFANVYLGVENGHIRFCMLQNNLNLSEDGRIIIEGAMGIRSIDRIANFTAGFVLIIICLAIVFNLINSRTGRAVMAIRDNRIAAESVGIEVTKFKMTAFIISAAMAGAAGALFGNNYSSLIANKFNIDTSILILVFVVLGGQGNILGGIIAAAALTILPEALRGLADYRMLMYAIILIIVMLVKNSTSIQMFLDQKFGKLKKKGKEAK